MCKWFPWMLFTLRKTELAGLFCKLCLKPPLWKSTKIQVIKTRAKTNISYNLFTFEALTNSLPAYITCKIQVWQTVWEDNTRSAARNHLDIPRCSLNKTTCAIPVKCPTEIGECATVNRFRNAYFSIFGYVWFDSCWVDGLLVCHFWEEYCLDLRHKQKQGCMILYIANQTVRACLPFEYHYINI